jgi:phosphoserine phosphatase RsbU/P
MPSLILIKSPGNVGANQSYALGHHAAVIGRDEGCEIVLANQAVSKRHAQINPQSGSYHIEDLKSRNGTTVNNEPVQSPRRLVHEDRVKICDFLFRFHDESAREMPPLPLGLSRLSSVLDGDGDDGLSTIENALSAGIADKLLDSQPSERLRAIYDISIALAKSPTLESLFAEIAEQMLKVFRQADRCFVILKDDDDRLVAREVRVRRAGGAADDQRFSKTIVRKCLTTGEAYLSEDASGDAALGTAMSIAEFRIRSVMCVPLAVGVATPFGAIQLDTQDRSKKFKSSDLELLVIVANLAAVAVEKGSLQEQATARDKQQKEIELAVRVQRGFLPQKLPEMPGYEFFHHYSAAQSVGGDYYDFIPLGGGRIAVALADVAGKGVPAALLMAKLSAEVRFCLFAQPDPALAIRLLNEQLINGGIGDRFVTFALAIIDPAIHAVTVVNAGHIAPLLYKSGCIRQAISTDDTGLPLGVMSGYDYVSATVTLDDGETIIIFSDGVTDAMDPMGTMFTLEGIHRVLTVSAKDLVRASVIGERLVRAIRVHASGREQNDDIACVCVGRVAGPAAEKSLTDTSSVAIPKR